MRSREQIELDRAATKKGLEQIKAAAAKIGPIQRAVKSMPQSKPVRTLNWSEDRLSELRAQARQIVEESGVAK